MPIRFTAPGSDYVRTANVYIPPDWYDHVPIPLVLVLHGGGMNATSMAQQYPFHRAVEQYVVPAGIPAPPTDFGRCIVVYLDGLFEDEATVAGVANYSIGHPRVAATQPWRYGNDIAACER